MELDLEELKRCIAKGYSIRKLAVHFNVATLTIQRKLEKYGLKTQGGAQGRVCKRCGKLLVGRQQIFCSGACKFAYYTLMGKGKKRKDDYVHLQTARARDRKEELIKAVNGGSISCLLCGFDKHMSALQFHHKNRSTKCFNVSGRRLSTMPYDKLLEEASKCIVLCATCHCLVHNTDFYDAKLKDLDCD